jgi:hypothetical protein
VDIFTIANKWLSTCATSHEVCRNKNESRSPTRLISILDDTIKLVITADWEALPKYATLSYCWGRDEFTKLTPENLESFLTAIPHETCQKHFKMPSTSPDHLDSNSSGLTRFVLFKARMIQEIGSGNQPICDPFTEALM